MTKLLYAFLIVLTLTGCEIKSLSEEAHAIQLGMTLKEVNSILDDEPYKTEKKGEITRHVWLYTSRGIQRAIHVDFKDGRVWELPDTKAQLNGYRRE